jgi:ABC-type Mn2+/Zn2+ transport system permease subunit
MLKLKTHSGFHDLFRFWYVQEYKYGSILWLEDNNLYLSLRKMSHTIYVTWILLRPLSALSLDELM